MIPINKEEKRGIVGRCHEIPDLVEAAMKRAPKNMRTQAEVLLASRRRCCMCIFLDDNDKVRPGQIAHLNRNAGDPRFDNLVWLCLEHHDAYDTRRSQSKGYSEIEVRAYREQLYAKYPKSEAFEAKELQGEDNEPEVTNPIFGKVIDGKDNNLDFLKRPWRYPLWQVKNQPEYFAYRAQSGFDGVCLVERIDLPDGRIVIACIETAGNPGTSITNSVEVVALQVCERFDIAPDKLIWLEHYDALDDDGEWRWVKFGTMPPQGPFADPTWDVMTPDLWRSLRLRPRKRLRVSVGEYESKIRKMFHWPIEAFD